MPAPTGVDGFGDGLDAEPVGRAIAGLGVTPTGSEGIATAGGLTVGKAMGVGMIGGKVTGTLGIGRESVGSGVTDGSGTSSPAGSATKVLAWLSARAEVGRITAASAAVVPHPTSANRKSRVRPPRHPVISSPYAQRAEPYCFK
jgi:hypothetical protein